MEDGNRSPGSGTGEPADGDKQVELHIISDSTGETAARIAAVVERQFPELDFDMIRHPRVITVGDIERALRRARGRRAVVFYTLVEPHMREAARSICRRHHIRYCDLLRQPMAAITGVSGYRAKMEPGALPPLNSAYFKRVAAIEYAVRFDDGYAPEGLRDAEVVLVGVSRTSKTPLSIYLGYLGYRAANVPVVGGIDPPEALFEIERRRIIGLTIEAERLAEIRGKRIRTLGGSRGGYAELLGIYEELEQAHYIHNRLACPVVDVTNLAVEETAHRVIQILEQKGLAR